MTTQRTNTSTIPRRMPLLKLLPALLLTLTVAACGGQDDGSELAGHELGAWQQAAAVDWAAEPGEQLRLCSTKTVGSDLYVGAFRITAPLGTKHVQLSYTDSSGPDGAIACDQATGQQLIASGSITDSWELPKHVALHVPAGKQLLLELTVENLSSTALQGTSSVEIALRPASEVIELAEALELQPTADSAPSLGSITLPEDGFLFAIQPHMGPSGHRLQVTARSSFSGNVTLLDAAYPSKEQTTRLLQQHVPMRAGEPIELRCDFEPAAANTPKSTSPGSVAQPSCYALLYHY